MMDRQFATFFISLVKELLLEEDDRERLFEILRRYKSDQNLDQLVTDLKSILDEPNKLELYDFMRPLIMLRHQIEFSKQVPTAPGVKLRAIRLIRNGRESLGFTVRGGMEHGVGIFVTDVTPDSQADKQGLMVGDEIVRVNGFTIAEAIHDDVLTLIKSRDEIVLRVTQIGMIPVRDDPMDKVTWKYAHNKDDAGEDETDGPAYEMPQDLKIYVDTTGYDSIGCGIQSGPRNFPGIFIEKVRPNSVAEELGLQRGDQIVEVNEVSFRHISFKEAVITLKSSRQLNILIRKGVGLNLFNHLPTTHTSSNAVSANPFGASINRHGPSSHHHENNNSNNFNGNIQNRPFASGTDNGSAYETLSRSTPNPRRYEFEQPELDEASLIQHQLATSNRPLFGFSQKSCEETHTAQPVMSISAEVHSSPPLDAHSESVASSHSDELREEIEQRRKESTHSSPLSGAAAILAERRLQKASGASFLGKGHGSYELSDNVPKKIYDMFDSLDIDGRTLKSLTFNKNADLGIAIEGGVGSVIGGRIFVAMVFDDGLAHQTGKMKVGDQLMALDGKTFVDIPIAWAEEILQNPRSFNKETRELIFCKSSFVNEEDSVTYF